MSYVYILRSLKDNAEYVGSTNNLTRRLSEHNSAKVRSTKYRRPLVLEAYQICNSIGEAAKLEKKYKRSHDQIEKSIRRGLVKVVSQ